MLYKNDLEDDIAAYIRDRLPQAPMQTVFDVGSNVGWFTFQFGRVYREARFHMFEPVTSVCDAIPDTLANDPGADLATRVIINRIALGHEAGSALITAQLGITVNHIVTTDQTAVPTEMIEIIRGDDYCTRDIIDRINFLKIDAEGFDMNVIIGFSGMLSRGAVDFVQVEAGMCHENREHIHVDAFSAALGCFGYRMFRVINQASGRAPYLTRADVVYIHERFANSLHR